MSSSTIDISKLMPIGKPRGDMPKQAVLPVMPSSLLPPMSPLPQDNPAASPMQIVSPDAINEVFLKDPKEVTDADIDMLISHFRSERAKWEAAEIKGEHKRKPKGSDSEASKTQVALLKIDDLEL